MSDDASADPAAEDERFFSAHPEALAIYVAIRTIIGRIGPVDVRVSKSQVAFRRRRGFAFVWLPGKYLPRPGADVVLSVALDRRIESTRFKEVVHPAGRTWIHHLEVRSLEDLDGEVDGWLREAYAAAERTDRDRRNGPDAVGSQVERHCP